MDTDNLSVQNSPERQEDAQGYTDALDIGLDDSQLLQIIGRRVEDSEKHWNKELDLDKVREENENYYLNKSYDEDDLYDYQAPYKDNRVFISVETLLPLVLANPPQPVAGEAQDTEASKELASNLEDALLGLYEDLYLKRKIQDVGRDLLKGMRLGVLKYGWDMNLGPKRDGKRTGGIKVEHVRPTRVVLDMNTTPENMDNPPMIAEYCTATIQELGTMYPDKKEELYKLESVNETMHERLGTPIQYIKIWFTYFDDNDEKQEGYCVKYKTLIFDKMKNPHFNYDDPQNNFFDSPKKPYILFNYITDGKYPLDVTSLTEQAKRLQDIVNKTGRQIVDNADQATGGLVYNTEMLGSEEASKLVGDPREKIGVKGSVRDAVTRLPYNQQPAHVYQLQLDARNEIDNLFGTSSSLRGEKTKINTLGQEILAQRSNLGRLQSFADCLEDGADKLYKGLVQMMKVFWDEPTMIKYTGEDGKTAFMEFSRDKIEDGVTLRVKAGSVLPTDAISRRQQGEKMAGMLDPLSLGEMIGEKDPKEFAKRVTYFKFMMDKYVQEYLGGGEGEGQDAQKAQADIKAISEGSPVQPPEAPTKEYIAVYTQFVQSEEFKQLPPPTQQAHIEFLKEVIARAKAGLKMGGGEPSSSSQTQPDGMPAQAPMQDAQQPAQAPQPQQQGLMSRFRQFVTGQR